METAQMGWLAWLVIGAVAGWGASMVMRTSQGLLTDILIGIVGAFIGGLIFEQFQEPGITGFNIWSIFVAFTGAVVLLMVIRLLTGRRLFSR